MADSSFDLPPDDQPPMPEWQPPRPKNKWILYRTDKMKELGPPPDGSKRTQAQVSQLVAMYWQNEHPSVRAKYERMAEQQKAAHAKQFKNYVYKPLKKADKERLREVARQQKKERAIREREAKKRARYQPYPTPVPLNHTPYYNSNADVRWGPAGPSPPLSAASSRTSSPSSDAATDLNETYATSPSSGASTSSTTSSSRHTKNAENANADSVEASLANTIPSAVSATESPMMSSSAIDASAEDLWSQQVPQFSLPSDISTPSMEIGSLDQWQSEFEQGSSHGTIAESSLNFQSEVVYTPVPEWEDFTSLDMGDSIQALLGSTDDPSIFQISELNNNAYNMTPPDQIDIVNMAPLPMPQDMPFLQEFTEWQDLHMPQPTSMLPMLSDDMLSPDFYSQFDATSPEQATTSRATSYGFIPFPFDFDGSFPTLEQQPSADLSQPGLPMHAFEMPPPPLPPVTSTASTYTPPSGAVNSSVRRVGGTWRPDPAFIASMPPSPMPPNANLGPWYGA